MTSVPDIEGFLPTVVLQQPALPQADPYPVFIDGNGFYAVSAPETISVQLSCEGRPNDTMSDVSNCNK